MKSISVGEFHEQRIGQLRQRIAGRSLLWPRVCPISRLVHVQRARSLSKDLPTKEFLTLAATRVGHKM
jgi:hypothetical protein